jgi:DmsE family decaheme c-type cytochrome
VRDNIRDRSCARVIHAGRILTGVLILSMTACGVGQRTVQHAETEVSPGWPGQFAKPATTFHEVSLSELRAPLPQIAEAEYVNDDELCATCHQAYAELFAENVHRGIHQNAQSCEACHGPGSKHLETRGKEPGTIISFKQLDPVQSAEVCLQCHEQNACSPGAMWRTSKHAHAGITCTSCHSAHYNVPPGTPAVVEPGESAMNGSATTLRLTSFQEETAEETSTLPSLRGTSNNLGATAPDTCYRCHGDLADMQRIAGPHQICGPNGFNCTTCHDSHGNLLEYSRRDLCLQCHNSNTPTMAWHSSTHALYGVACVDCHTPHLTAGVQQFVGISYAGVDRPNRMPMSVNEPGACFKCHPETLAMFSLPSHHPIQEQKMLCSDCHDGHGQMEGNLKAETLNLLCWKCHAEKQGPFAYEHPPVTENCGYCHSPHGTVANNLLKQPATFLCLRCHVGHRDGTHGGGARVNIDTIPQIRPGFYTDCTACHAQIHGTDLPSPHFPGMFR